MAGCQRAVASWLLDIPARLARNASRDSIHDCRPYAGKGYWY